MNTATTHSHPSGSAAHRRRELGAVRAMWLRQVKKYLRSKSRIVGSLGQPLLFFLAFGFGLGGVFEAAGRGSYIQLIAPGIVAMSVLFTAVFTGIEIIWDRQFGFLRETLVAPVSRFAIMLGKTLGGATVSAIQGVIVIPVMLLAGFRMSWGGLPLALLAILLIGSIFSAFGIAVASRMRDMQAFPIIMNFVIMPLFFLSGALFPLDATPAAIRFIAAVNPLSYGVDLLRGAMVGAYHFGLWLDLGVLAASLAIVLALGAWSFRGVEA